MEELRKEGRGESQREGSPAQRPREGEEGKGRREGGCKGVGLKWGRREGGGGAVQRDQRSYTAKKGRAKEKEGSVTSP